MPLIVSAQTVEMTEWPVDEISEDKVVSEKVLAIRARLAEKKAEQTIEEEPIESAIYTMNVNTQKIQEERLGWINYERSTKGLQPLVLDETLNTTAIEWANYLGESRKFSRMHQRPGQSCTNAWCYDVTNRFLERGVSNGAESIMYGGYKCTIDDCTEQFIETTRGRIGGPSGFLGFLLGEKSYNGVHYRMMMNPNYTKLGVWFSKTTHSGFGGAYMGVLHYSL